MENVELFEEHAVEYDSWFERNRMAYETEIFALKKLLPKGFGLEVGIGTGRFALPLGVKIGIEPARRMAEMPKVVV